MTPVAGSLASLLSKMSMPGLFMKLLFCYLTATRSLSLHSSSMQPSDREPDDSESKGQNSEFKKLVATPTSPLMQMTVYRATPISGSRTLSAPSVHRKVPGTLDRPPEGLASGANRVIRYSFVWRHCTSALWAMNNASWLLQCFYLNKLGQVLIK